MKTRRSPDKLQGLKRRLLGGSFSLRRDQVNEQAAQLASNNSKILLLVSFTNPVSFYLNWKLNALLCQERTPTLAPSLRQRSCNNWGVDYWVRAGFSACHCSISSSWVQGPGGVLLATRQGPLSFYTLSLFAECVINKAGGVRACGFRSYISRQVNKQRRTRLLRTSPGAARRAAPHRPSPG